VAYPIFAQVADDHERLLRGFRMSIRGVMFLNIPMMLGIAAVAEPLILTLFGPVWAPAIPLLQILALGGVLFPLHVLNLNVLIAMGHSAKFLKLEVVKKVVGISLIILGARYGIQGMAWAVVISSCFAFVFNAYYTGKLLGYGSLLQSRDCLPALSCGIIMTVLVFACDHAISGPPQLRLVILSSSGSITFMLMAKVFKIPELADAIGFIQKHAHLRRTNTL
jgi:teichuronic acid exporter